MSKVKDDVQMAIEAPLSKYSRNNVCIFIAVLLGLAVWFTYDGYFSEKFIEEHTLNYGTAEASPDGTLVFNQRAWPFLVGGAVLCAAYLLVIKNRKVVAGDTDLVINGKKSINYDSIERIDKTHFDNKGYFVITYKNQQDNEVDVKLCDRSYDNLGAILEELIAKIS